MRKKKLVGLGALVGVIVIGLAVAIVPLIINNSLNDNITGFPDFYTKTEDYFITRIGAIPEIDESSYRLQVTGCIDNPTNYSLSQLQALPLIEFPLTIECIGNAPSGQLLSTAKWKGFSIYNLLTTLGLESNATGVKYYAADGYYATHTMEQLMNNTVIGALYINNEELPPVQGFPLRIINPGYYGAKQPAWVIGIEVIDMPLQDFWDDIGWDTSPPMTVDSKIFFPEDLVPVESGNLILIGGAAYGGTRISKVEYTVNDGLEWHQAEIFQSVDFDHVWIFWRINFTTTELGLKIIYVKATDIFNNTQPRLDTFRKDGDNSWPSLYINVI
ncbi:unnamed protein product, partial [marine sediment metagenome]